MANITSLTEALAYIHNITLCTARVESKLIEFYTDVKVLIQPNMTYIERNIHCSLQQYTTAITQHCNTILLQYYIVSELQLITLLQFVELENALHSIFNKSYSCKVQ